LIKIATESIKRITGNITELDPLDSTVCMVFNLCYRYWAGMEEVFLGTYHLAVLYNCFFNIANRFHNDKFKTKFQNQIEFNRIKLDKHLINQLDSKISSDKNNLMIDLNKLALKTIRVYNPDYKEPY
jgi:hypothetical protein